jgi:cyclopropane fatty-acyl-phospholipid synthase-like methyltransferase
MNGKTASLASRFPKTDRYHPDWILAGVSGGANSLWLTEWLAAAMDLRPRMRVLDLGCGRACSSIFLHREFGVEVWATDLWCNPSENLQRARDAGAEEGVFPIHADARSLPFAGAFFDAIVSIDSFYYFGTDDLYLNYLAHFLKPDGQLGIAGAGLMRELDGQVPEHIRGVWTQDFWCLHSAAWTQAHWEKTGLVKVSLADAMPDGWRAWVEWQRMVAPQNLTEIEAVEADRGEYLGYIRCVATRLGDIKIEEYCWPDPLRNSPVQYTPKPLLKESRP